MSETAVHEARTATSCTCIEIQEMSSATETIVHRAVRHSTAAGLPRDLREAGDEISGADEEIRTEIDHGIEPGNKTDIESDARGTGAEKGMMIEAGIADEVRTENITGLQKDARTVNKGIGEEATVATRGAKEKYSTSICLKGRRCPRKKL